MWVCDFPREARSTTRCLQYETKSIFSEAFIGAQLDTVQLQRVQLCANKGLSKYGLRFVLQTSGGGPRFAWKIANPHEIVQLWIWCANTTVSKCNGGQMQRCAFFCGQMQRCANERCLIEQCPNERYVLSLVCSYGVQLNGAQLKGVQLNRAQLFHLNVRICNVLN